MMKADFGLWVPHHKRKRDEWHWFEGASVFVTDDMTSGCARIAGRPISFVFAIDRAFELTMRAERTNCQCTLSIELIIPCWPLWDSEADAVECSQAYASGLLNLTDRNSLAPRLVLKLPIRRQFRLMEGGAACPPLLLPSPSSPDEGDILAVEARHCAEVQWPVSVSFRTTQLVDLEFSNGFRQMCAIRRKPFEMGLSVRRSGKELHELVYRRVAFVHPDFRSAGDAWADFTKRVTDQFGAPEHRSVIGALVVNLWSRIDNVKALDAAFAWQAP